MFYICSFCGSEFRFPSDPPRAVAAALEKQPGFVPVYDRLAEGRIEELKKLAMVAPPQVKPEPPPKGAA